MIEPYLKVREAASILQVAPVTIRRMIKRGELRCVRAGRGIRIPVSALPTTTSIVPLRRAV